MIGEWLDGLPKPNIQWKITCENNYEYWGYIELDQSKSDFDILDINDFHKTKEGELYCKPNDRYFGSFVNNMKDGYGVQVFSNKNRYFGGWKEGKFHGHGTFIYYDGTMYVLFVRFACCSVDQLTESLTCSFTIVHVCVLLYCCSFCLLKVSRNILAWCAQRKGYHVLAQWRQCVR